MRCSSATAGHTGTVTNSARVLVVEDHKAIRQIVLTALRAEGMAVTGLPDGTEFETTLETFRPHVIVLDWMLPGRDGPALAAVARRRCDAGLMMLTARHTVPDRLLGFEAGVDDYLAKPFEIAELVARIRALLRRLGRISQVVEVDDLVIDPDAGIVFRAGQQVELTATELRLLCYLADHRGRVLSPTQILTQVWGYEEYADNLIQVHISALRRKIEAHGPRLIHTVRGLGYVLRPPDPS